MNVHVVVNLKLMFSELASLQRKKADGNRESERALYLLNVECTNNYTIEH
jgi:hypothetical protein